MITTKLDGEQFGEILLPRDQAATQLIDHLEQEKKLPLISIYGPSGVGKSDLAGPLLAQRLKAISGRSNPKLLRVVVTKDDSALDIALRVTDLIIDHHTEFRSRKSATIFRDKIQRSVRRAPAEAAEKLRSMMRISEKGKFDLKKIQLVICLDSVDKLFETRARCGSDLSKSAICGDLNDPVGFLSRLVGMKTILFTIVHRSWVSRDVRTILDMGGIGMDRRFDLHLSYPDAGEVEEMVKTLLVPIKEQCANPGEIDEYGDLLIDSLRKNPALIGLLPGTLTSMFRDRVGGFSRGAGCVERHLENNGLVGDLAKKADEIYLQQNSNNKLALEEVFSNLIKGDGRLLIKDAVMSEELWAIALNFVDHRILAIDGRSYRNARFIVTHKALLSEWDRAVNWTGAKRSVGITQLRHLDDKALSWQLAERNKALLIGNEELMDDARMILRDSEMSSQLSPLTREYLTRSLKPKRNLKGMLLSRYIWVPVGAVVAGLFLILALIIVIPEEILRPDLAVAEPIPVETEPAAMETLPEPEPGPVLPKRFREEIKVEPVTGALLASAGKISDEIEPVAEELPLLSELELIPGEPPLVSEAVGETPVEPEAAPGPVEPPVITKADVMANLDQLKSEGNGSEYIIPLGLPSAQALFENGWTDEAKPKDSAGEDRHTAGTEFPPAEPGEEKLPSEPTVISSAGKAVPLEGLETATGHVEKTTLVGMKKDDSYRLFEGLTNHRLEIGGAESKIINISSKSTWREIMNAMGSGIAGENVNHVLDALRNFHEKTISSPDEVKNIQVSEFKDLTSHLGKVALIQQDRVAMQGAWKLELVSQNVVDLNTDLRMLMARIAMNAGRDEEAIAYLAKAPVQKKVNRESIDFLKAAIGWHFDEGGKATESFRKLLPPQVSAN